MHSEVIVEHALLLITMDIRGTLTTHWHNEFSMCFCVDTRQNSQEEQS
jgi:hypothetical protein